MKTGVVHGVMGARVFLPEDDGELPDGFPLNRIPGRAMRIS